MSGHMMDVTLQDLQEKREKANGRVQFYKITSFSCLKVHKKTFLEVP